MPKHRRISASRQPARALPDPADARRIQQRIVVWATRHGRDFPWRHTTNEYRIAVTELLLQQTTAAAVAAVYEVFFAMFPSWSSLAASPVGSIREPIARLGLANRRSIRLQEMAQWVVDHKGKLPCEREELEAVPGIGQYVASAVLVMARAADEPLLDVNMARVLERVFAPRELADLRDDPWLQQLSRLVFPGKQAGLAVLDFGASVCRPNPRCDVCPIRPFCAYAARPAPRP